MSLYPDQSIFKLHAQSSLSCYRKACLDSDFGVPMINKLTVRRIAVSAPLISLTLTSLAHQGFGQSAPSSYPDQPQCAVQSVQPISTPLLGFTKSLTSNSWVATQYASNGLNQVYAAQSDALPTLPLRLKQGGLLRS